MLHHDAGVEAVAVDTVSDDADVASAAGGAREDRRALLGVHRTHAVEADVEVRRYGRSALQRNGRHALGKWRAAVTLHEDVVVFDQHVQTTIATGVRPDGGELPIPESHNPTHPEGQGSTAAADGSDAAVAEVQVFKIDRTVQGIRGSHEDRTVLSKYSVLLTASAQRQCLVLDGDGFIHRRAGDDDHRVARARSINAGLQGTIAGRRARPVTRHRMGGGGRHHQQQTSQARAQKGHHVLVSQPTPATCPGFTASRAGNPCRARSQIRIRIPGPKNDRRSD